MQAYRTTVPVPELMQQYLAEIRGVAAIVDTRDEGFTIEIEAEGEYALAEIVFDLRATLNALGFGESLDIPRPTPVEASSDARQKERDATARVAWKVMREIAREQHGEGYVDDYYDSLARDYFIAAFNVAPEDVEEGAS